jgi:hypothetical protein
VLYQQASTGERSYTQVAIQFADGTAEQKNSLSNQFIEAAGQEGIAKLSATPEGQYALQIVYDHASSGGQKLMREVHEGQGNTAVDYTHKNENMCTAEAFHKEGATPEEQHLNNLMKQYGDHVSGEIPLPPSESIRLRNEIDRVSQLANPGQHNLWGDYSPQEKQYLAEQALQNRQAINNLGMWVGGPVFSALPALGRVLDAPEPVVEGLGQINAEMAGGKAFGRQGRGIQPVDTPMYSGPVKTYVLDAKSVKIEQSARVVQGQNIAPDKIAQGFTKAEFAKFSEAARRLAQEAGLPKGQLAVQGSRAKGTARPLTDKKPSDIDIILRVDEKTFNEFAQARINSVRPGTKLQKTLIKAAEKGQLSRFDISKDFNKQMFEILAPKSKFDIDFSIVKEGSKVDTPPFIDLGNF